MARRILPPGARVQVHEFAAGLDSGRVVVVQGPNRFRKFLENEPGRYKPFNGSNERLIKDDNGDLFTMFVNYLREVRP